MCHTDARSPFTALVHKCTCALIVYRNQILFARCEVNDHRINGLGGNAWGVIPESSAKHKMHRPSLRFSTGEHTHCVRKTSQWYELRPGAWLARTGAARRARLCRCTEPTSGFVQDWCDENQIGFRGIAWHGSVAQDPHLHRWRERAPGLLSGPLGPAWTLTLPHPALPCLISHPGQVWALRQHPRSPCLSTAIRPYSRSHIYHPIHGHDAAARRPQA